MSRHGPAKKGPGAKGGRRFCHWGGEKRPSWEGLDLVYEEVSNMGLDRQKKVKGVYHVGTKSKHLEIEKRKMPARNNENILA